MDRNPRLAQIIGRLESPIGVAVRGRDGVGRRTVADALVAAGVDVVPDGCGADMNADVDVVVIAETLKPEDRSLLDAAQPTVIVLNKADVTGFAAGGPLALAHHRAAQYRRLVGVPIVPAVGLLAVPALDDELVGALRTLVAEPADLTSTDAFVQGAHPLPQEVRRRLLAALDRFGIAHAVLAMGAGADPATLPALLRRLSLFDRVLAHLDAAGASTRYRRARSAVTELRLLAAQSGDDRLVDFLSTNDAVLAMMSAAVDVVEAAGLHVDRGDDRAAHLRRAVHWRRYAAGPVNALHRGCAADISRGSLRLLGRTR